MFYTIYKTTNLINGKYYIGKHQTLNIDDTYLGSGIAITKAINKYGRENFTKEILFVFDNELDMNNKEKEIVTEEFISSKNNYNRGVGGQGGPLFKGKTHSTKTRLIISENSKKNIGHKKSDEALAKERSSRYEKNDGRWNSEATVAKITDYAKNRDSSINEKISDSVTELYKLDENGENIQRNKISNAMKKYYSNPEARKKQSIRMKGVTNNIDKFWICNFELRISKMISTNEPIPIGWVKGRKFFPK